MYNIPKEHFANQLQAVLLTVINKTRQDKAGRRFALRQSDETRMVSPGLEKYCRFSMALTCGPFY